MNILEKYKKAFANNHGLNTSELYAARRTCVPKALAGAVGAPIPDVLKIHRERQIRSDRWLAFWNGMRTLVQTGDPLKSADVMFRPRGEVLSHDISNIFNLIRLGRRSNSTFGQNLRKMNVSPLQLLTLRKIETHLKSGDSVILLGSVVGTNDAHAVHVVKAPSGRSFVDSQTGQEVMINGSKMYAIVMSKKRP